ncbi:MAG: hypothetical protein ACK5H4_03525 [Lacrimispora sphenoides]
MKNRKNEFMKAINLIMPEQFSKSSRRIVLSCEENSREMAHSFVEAFKVAMEQAVNLQDRKEKGNVGYILFSHLYSSMFLKQYLIRIDLMDRGFYSDTAQSMSYWDAGNIYHLFEEDVEAIRKELERDFPRIREYETDSIRYAYATYYHRLAKTFIQAILEEALPEKGFLPEQARLENRVSILFGEYMGEADVLFKLGEEKTADEIF